jgi:hypothetical protein
MNLKTITLSTLCFLSISALFFNSCRTRETDADITEGREAVLLERTNDDIINIVHQADLGILDNYGCAIITKNTASNPKTIVIDFGPTPCKSQDGKMRSGKILVDYDLPFADSGSYRKITFQNYFVDTNQIKGTKSVANLGENSFGNIVINIASMDTIIKKKSLDLVTGILTRQREYTNGIGSAQWIDDTYMITGNGSGTRANGFNFTTKITKALHVDFSCVYKILSGEMQIQPQAKEIRTLQFGAGVCDKVASLSINNKAYSFDFE